MRGGAGFFDLIFLPQKGENGPRIGIFQFNEKFSHWLFLNLVDNESLHYLVSSCRNPILRKNLDPQI